MTVSHQLPRPAAPPRRGLFPNHPPGSGVSAQHLAWCFPAPLLKPFPHRALPTNNHGQPGVSLSSCPPFRPPSAAGRDGAAVRAPRERADGRPAGPRLALLPQARRRQRHRPRGGLHGRCEHSPLHQGGTKGTGKSTYTEEREIGFNLWVQNAKLKPSEVVFNRTSFFTPALFFIPLGNPPDQRAPKHIHPADSHITTRVCIDVKGFVIPTGTRILIFYNLCDWFLKKTWV